MRFLLGLLSLILVGIGWGLMLFPFFPSFEVGELNAFQTIVCVVFGLLIFVLAMKLWMQAVNRKK